MHGVAMLVNEFPPLQVGGAERQAERLSADLVKRGWKVWVITRHAAGLPSIESRLGFQIIRPASMGPGKIKTFSFVFGSILALWKYRGEYEILHAHLAFGPAFAAVLAAKALGKKVIVKLGNSGEFGDIIVSQRTWRGRFKLFVLKRWTDALIVLDESMQLEAEAAGFSTSVIRRMSNGIDTQSFQPLQPKAEAKKEMGLSDKIIVLSMGRLSKQKNLMFLLQAFSHSFSSNHNLHLLVLGDGPERASMEAQARKLGLQQNITFTGSQSNVLPYLSAADIFVLPSRSEGISNSLLEAMSAGLACLATPVGGNPQVLENGLCGVILPMNDLSAWSKALSDFCQSREMREKFGLLASMRVTQEYDFEKIGSRMEALYLELLSRLPSNPRTLP